MTEQQMALKPAPSSYQAPTWLPNGHFQTIYPALLARKPAMTYRRERWATPDGDFIDIDFSPDNGRPEQALLILFHGLEGCSRSHYALSMMQAAVDAGARGAVVHFRGCSGELNLRRRAYHSGDSAEIDWIIRRFAEQYSLAYRVCMGVSLGANAMLKWLGEQSDQAYQLVGAAAAISAPQDLHAGALSLSRGFNMVYTQNFLKSLKIKSQRKLEQFPGLFDRNRMLKAANFFDFDDAVTAPMHGFDSCFDYWAKSSCKAFLGRIAVPTLIINARNDPFLPAQYLASDDEVSDCVELDYPAAGGHVGFWSGKWPGSHQWLTTRVMTWFNQHRPHGHG